MMTDKNEISIGINTNLDPKKLDGYAWVKSINGGLTKLPFMVDNHILLSKKQSNVIKSLFDQVLKMGIVCMYLEIFCNGIRSVFYHTNTEAPIYIDYI